MNALSAISTQAGCGCGASASFKKAMVNEEENKALDVRISSHPGQTMKIATGVGALVGGLGGFYLKEKAKVELLSILGPASSVYKFVPKAGVAGPVAGVLAGLGAAGIMAVGGGALLKAAGEKIGKAVAGDEGKEMGSRIGLGVGLGAAAIAGVLVGFPIAGGVAKGVLGNILNSGAGLMNGTLGTMLTVLGGVGVGMWAGKSLGKAINKVPNCIG